MRNSMEDIAAHDRFKKNNVITEDDLDSITQIVDGMKTRIKGEYAIHIHVWEDADFVIELYGPRRLLDFAEREGEIW